MFKIELRENAPAVRIPLKAYFVARRFFHLLDLRLSLHTVQSNALLDNIVLQRTSVM